jgi:hypothetical protein
MAAQSFIAGTEEEPRNQRSIKHARHQIFDYYHAGLSQEDRNAKQGKAG